LKSNGNQEISKKRARADVSGLNEGKEQAKRSKITQKSGTITHETRSMRLPDQEFFDHLQESEKEEIQNLIYERRLQQLEELEDVALDETEKRYLRNWYHQNYLECE
jgi:hypothetical protein